MCKRLPEGMAMDVYGFISLPKVIGLNPLSGSKAKAEVLKVVDEYSMKVPPGSPGKWDATIKHSDVPG